MKTKSLAWGAIIFLVSYHLSLFTLLPLDLYFSPPSFGLWATMFSLFVLTGLSITAGYHRLYAHKTYRTNPIIESILLFFGAMAFQNSVLKWAYDHRLHHAHVDEEDDPYSIKKGFWHAHWLWICYQDNGVQDTRIVSDLLRNKLVMFQHKYFLPIAIASNLLVFLAFGWLFNDFLGALVLAVLLRMFLVHHSTWFINSLAHTWGEKPFSRELSAADNYFLAFLTFGEGYHNYHHTFANDYRNGIRWYHFDPTKWLIWSLHKLGLAHNLKSADRLSIEKRMIIADKAMLLEHIKKLPEVSRESFNVGIDEISERLLSKLAQFNEFKKRYSETKRAKAPRDIKLELRNQLLIIKKSLQDDWNHWVSLVDEIRRQPLVNVA